MQVLQRCVRFVLLSTLAALPAIGQTPKASTTPPQYSDADKKKIAEIEQRPEIQDRIRTEWESRRRQDLDYLYNLNLSEDFTDIRGPEFVTYRQMYGVLYPNPMLQRYLNAMGQRLVPVNSPNLYSFKIVLDPIPMAEAYTTGTVVVSTGLISMMDNEAQLAYVLGHEIAHIEKNHAYDMVRMSIIEPELNREKEEAAYKKKAMLVAGVTVAAAAVGGKFGGANIAVPAAIGALTGTTIASHFIFRDHTTVTQWSDVYENEADEASLGYILAQSYDVREAPKLYVRLEKAEARDPRLGLGFVASEIRMKARAARIDEVLTGSMKADIEAKLKAGGLTGSSGEFNLIMASLKRDNGIAAFDHDLFAMARDNLDEAVNLRSNDALAQLYLGKVIMATARNGQDRQEGQKHILKSIEYDGKRGAYPDPHLEYALDLIGENGDKTEIRKELLSYIALYHRQHAGSLPSNMHILYDYLTLVGETNWYTAPVSVVSTRNVEPIRTDASGKGTALTAPEILSIATGTGTPAEAPEAAQPKQPLPPQPKPHPAAQHTAVKKTGTQ
ncbi:MAG: M48 family metalloprotease [Terracidiphilus sp.]